MSDPIILTKEDLAEKVLNIPYDYPHIFSVIFTKKDGSIRHMTCRRGVVSRSAGVRDGGTKPYDPKYNFHEKRLLSVFDVNKDPSESHDGKRGSYRSISVDKILQLKIEGQTYRTASHNDSQLVEA